MTDKLLDSSIPASPQDSLDFITNVLQSSTAYSIIGKGMDGTILLWKEGARRFYRRWRESFGVREEGLPGRKLR